MWQKINPIFYFLCVRMNRVLLVLAAATGLLSLSGSAAETLGTAMGNATSSPNKKRGTSGLRTCKDAKTLKLDHTWHYSWGNEPWGDKCDEPRVREFVPMVW